MNLRHDDGRRHPSGRRIGRPPRLQGAIVNALTVHPELMGHPSRIAGYLVRASPGFEEVDGNDVSIAFSKLRRRFGDAVEPRDLHADAYHVGRIVVLSPDMERVCQECGASLGYSADLARGGMGGSGGAGHEHNSFANELHRVFRTNPIPIPGKEGGMISKAGVVAGEFGVGVEGRLTMKALMGLEEACKSLRRDELPQEITTQLARMVERQCRKRANGLREARLEEAKDAVISACLEGMERFPQFAPTLRRLNLEAAAFFPDLTASSNNKSTNKKDKAALMLEEEERTFRSMENEERKSHPLDTTIEA